MAFEYLISLAAIGMGMAVMFSCISISRMWRKKNRWLSKDYMGIGISFPLLIASSVAWFLTENIIAIYALSIFSISFALSMSYAILRMLHPEKRRPKNLMILAYGVIPFVYLLSPSFAIVPFAIITTSAAIIFSSFAMLFTICRGIMRPYAFVGMLSQVFAILATYFTLYLRFPVSPIDQALFLYFIFLGQTTFAFYGLYTVSRYATHHFLKHGDR